jgi:CO dehydrogenase/acetyl-CoA synthase alpha subunit
LEENGLTDKMENNNIGRSIKLTHWLELSKKHLVVLPDDWWKFVRNEADLPLAKREMLLKLLRCDPQVLYQKKETLGSTRKTTEINVLELYKISDHKNI